MAEATAVLTADSSRFKLSLFAECASDALIARRQADGLCDSQGRALADEGKGSIENVCSQESGSHLIAAKRELQ